MLEINVEYELNYKWIIDEDGEIIGEANFVVPAEWLRELHDNKYADTYEYFDEFIEFYDPETDGKFIYQEAIKDNVLIEVLGIKMY